MSKYSVILVTCFVLLATCGWIAAKRIIVQTHPDAAQPGDIAAGIGRVIKALPRYNSFVIEVEDDSELDVIRNVGSVAAVYEDSKENFVGTIDSINDPRAPEQWALKALNASQVWSKFTVDPVSNIMIAICDTGLYYDHEDLQIEYIKGPDYAYDDNDPLDQHGHGTHVAGIIAAAANNAKGIAGFSFGIKLWIGQVFDSAGSGWTTDIMQCISDATTAGADVISLSVVATSGSPAYEQAVNTAVADGVLVVACGGNQNGQGPSYPGFYPAALSVANMNSNYQRSTTSNIGDYQDIAGPGESILSTIPGVSSYGLMTGCSMATPYVSAVAGLLKSANPSLTNTQLRTILETTAIDIGAVGKDTSFGFGLVNPLGALRYAQNVPPTISTPGDISVLEGSEISFFVNCTGPELDDACALNVTDLPSFLTQEQVSQSSVLVSGTASSLGQFVLSTSATDSFLGASQQDVTLTVNAPPVYVPPVSSPTSNQPARSPNQLPGGTPTDNSVSSGCTLGVSCVALFTVALVL